MSGLWGKPPIAFRRQMGYSVSFHGTSRFRRLDRKTMKTTSRFTRFTRWASRMMGRPMVFACGAGFILAWALSGPLFGFSNTWQLVVNSATTIITFLMVFLIQSTQNRGSEAIQIKLDELIRTLDGAHNALLDLEELEEEDMDRIRNNYENLARSARKHLRNGGSDSNCPRLRLRKTTSH